ncbi:transporter substrate-binding domain-containing protein [Gammaproteobacteria bacterium AB-CW1]|uniref:Transporter substrate-binding domain-containing protein n=1 Tax=Natronospira elongata TaxID=3110268 RepID=A0AAP6JG41_9GAMM|nr:transporter substrate-binding domain-containing protein [Gammaproteobacteria bacterium AB-CW1]
MAQNAHKLNITAGLLGLLIAFSASVSAASDSLTLAGGEEVPLSGRDLLGGGLMTELVAATYHRAGYQTSVKFQPWARAYVDTRDTYHDASFSYVRSKQRVGEMYYSRPLLRMGVKLISANNGPVAELPDGPTRLCLPIGYAVPDSIGWRLSSLRSEIIRARNMRNCLDMVGNGRAHLTVTAPIIAAHLISKNTDLDPLDDFSFHPAPETWHELHLITSRAHPDGDLLKREFNRAWETLCADGTAQSIMARHQEAFQTRIPDGWSRVELACPQPESAQ